MRVALVIPVRAKGASRVCYPSKDRKVRVAFEIPTVARWLAALAALTELHKLEGSAGG